MKRVGLLSGTFDPVHQGHVELAQAAREAGGLDTVWLWVNAEPAHKSGVADYEHRLTMARLAVEREPGLRVYEGVAAREAQVAGAFAEVGRDLGADEVVFVLGIDTLMRLDRWDDVGSVVKSTTYMAAKRDGAGEASLAELRLRLGPLGEDLRVWMFEFERAADASSAYIREAMQAGKQPAFLDPRVRDYISHQQLYR